MITLHTSAIYALLNRRDRAHAAAVAALESDPGPYLVPAATLGEVAYLVEDRLGIKVLDLLLATWSPGRTPLTAARPTWGERGNSSSGTRISRWATSMLPSSPAPNAAADAS